MRVRALRAKRSSRPSSLVSAAGPTKVASALACRTAAAGVQSDPVGCGVTFSAAGLRAGSAEVPTQEAAATTSSGAPFSQTRQTSGTGAHPAGWVPTTLASTPASPQATSVKSATLVQTATQIRKVSDLQGPAKAPTQIGQAGRLCTAHASASARRRKMPAREPRLSPATARCFRCCLCRSLHRVDVFRDSAAAAAVTAARQTMTMTMGRTRETKATAATNTAAVAVAEAEAEAEAEATAPVATVTASVTA